MDDYSNTNQSIKTKGLCDKYGAEYVKTKKPLSCSGVRREALNKIDTPYHLILDDDLLFYDEKAEKKNQRQYADYC